MADKKKKIFIKETMNAPRRPVILKSDRETSTKDSMKVKDEKERQPTIILKTREQSTPKDERPTSPKSLGTEAESTQPSKIAHNENKERKVPHTPSNIQDCMLNGGMQCHILSSYQKREMKTTHSPNWELKPKKYKQKLSQPAKLMTGPVKLLDENLDFNTSALEFLNDTNSNYLVVGVIGMQGVGKSMILNLIAQNSPIDNLCKQILNSHEVPADSTNDSNDISVENQMDSLNITETQETQDQHSIFKFKMQDMEYIERGVHCTKGIDMYITTDRVILLDCQPLWSPSLIEETNSNPITARSANILTVDCLQIASYLMAVCHVLIVVQDWFADYNFLRYIQTAEMLKPSLSASTVNTNQENPESTSSGENHPHLLLLHNRCQLEDFTPEAIKTMQDLYRKVFQRSNLQLQSGMYLYSDTNKNGININNVSKSYTVETCGSPINLFLLPEIYSDFDNRDIYRGHPDFEQLAKRLRWLLLGVNRHQITNVPNLSEKGWFQYCIKAWETIRKCTFFMEYERFLP